MADKVDLKPRRDLLDPQFDGYKLSLDSLPVYKTQLSNDIECVNLGDDQYSYHHAKVYGVFNHLFLDHWAPTNVYFIDNTWTVIKATAYDMSVECGSKVLQIPDAANQRLIPQRLNPSLQFISLDFAVLSDGAGKLHVIDTGNRSESLTNWKIIFSTDVVKDGEPFLLVDAVQHSEEENHHIECLCAHVHECSEEEKEKYKSSSYITLLEWITFKSVDRKVWSVSRRRQLVGRRPFDYVALDRCGTSVIIASEADFKFVSDSEKPVQQEAITEQNNTQNESKPEYTWQQTSEDISVQFTVPSEFTKSDIYLTLTHDHLDFGVKNIRSLLKGQLHGSVDVDASAWTMSGQRIELTLGKSNEEMWPLVVVGDTRGEMSMEPSQIAAIHERLAHLTSDQWNPDPELMEGKPYNSQELEDCDRFPDDTSVLQRIDGDNHRTIYTTNLSSHQWLFGVRLDKEKPPALCLRHDVDGLIWQPKNIVKEKESPWEHTSTFNAFGYVQASKQQRKFSTCPPSCSYAIICDCVRHIYIYRTLVSVTSSVRNRKTGKQVNSVAKQQVVALEAVDSIIGLQATDNKLFVTTKNCLFVINME